MVGYDTRFNSRPVAHLAADILAANGWRVLLADRPVPTPVVSYSVIARGAAGGLVVTASHNPARFNGIKLKGSFGGSATPEFTARVEAALGRIPPRRTPAAGAGRVETVDLLPDYLERLRSRIAVDRRAGPAPPHRGGRASRRDERAHARAGAARVGRGPAPPRRAGPAVRRAPSRSRSRRTSTSSSAEVRASGADLGLAMDGDGDRLGAVTGQGRYVTPHEVLTLLVRHLVRVRGWRGEVAKGFAMGVQVDRLCARLGLTLHVTPIGFKHIASLMRTRDILIGGEESGGMGFRDHLPERDGLLSALLVLEAVVASGDTLDALLRDLEAEAGAAAYRRRDYTLSPDRGRALVAALDAAPPARIGARPVTRLRDAGRAEVLARATGRGC